MTLLDAEKLREQLLQEHKDCHDLLTRMHAELLQAYPALALDSRMLNFVHTYWGLSEIASKLAVAEQLCKDLERGNNAPPEELRTLLENTSRYTDERIPGVFPNCKVCGGLGKKGEDGDTVEHFPDCCAGDIVVWAQRIWPAIDMEGF
jgi:hypothetical protein